MSLTSAINARLGSVAVFCCVLLLGILLYRMARVLCWMIISATLFAWNPSENKTLQRFARVMMVGDGTSFLLQCGLSIARVLATLLRAIVLVAYAMLPFLLLGLGMALVQERWAEAVFVVADGLDRSMVLRGLITVPLNVLAGIGSHALPLFNLGVLVFVQFPMQLLMWFLRGSEANHIVLAMREFGAAASPLAVAAGDFVSANTGKCGGSLSFCVNVSSDEVCMTTRNLDFTAQTCLDATTRGMDFMPAFHHLREAAAHAIMSVGGSCNALALLSNVTMFPLTDASAWSAMHSGLNGIFGIIVVAPSIAVQRCDLGGGFAARPAMCTPDFAPAFDRFADASMHLGDALTHWFDALYVLVHDDQRTIQTACADGVDYNSVWADPIAARLFGSNATVLVRMLPDVFAITDGVHAVFVSENPLRRAYAPSLWSVNAGFGVARTLLPSGVDARDGGVGLFGCSCAALLRCVIVTRGGEARDVNVGWSLAAEAQLLTCDRMRVVVQPLRWPQRRVAVQSTSPPQLLSADVAVYVIPVCGGSSITACLPEQSFTRGICFPYCLGLRMQHEGALPLTIRGAREWTDGVVLGMRNCASSSISSSSTVSTSCVGGADIAGQGLPVDASGSASACDYAWPCTSLAANKTLVAGYDASSSPPTFADISPGVRLVLDGQPLAVAGSVYMREYSDSKQKYYADFPTIVGNQYNEFTVESHTPLGVEVNPPPAVPSDQAPFTSQPTVDEPPLYVAENYYNPAALSPEAFWYAANPSYKWISAFAEYCATEGERTSAQLMLLSSYAPLRLQRVRYNSGACFISSLEGRHVCAPDLFTAATMPRTLPSLTAAQVSMSADQHATEKTGTLYDMCTRGESYNLWAESLEYFDGSNIVVGVRRGTIADLGGGGGTTVFYFVNVSDVRQIREGVPWSTSRAPFADSQFTNCPALRTLPNVGAFVGHSLAAVVHLVQMPVNLILNPFSFWELIRSRAEGACPENTLMHTAAENCGMQLLSLDAFFKSVYSANTALWDVVVWFISVVMPPEADEKPSQTSAVLRQFLEGAAVIGDASRIITLFDVESVVEIFDTGAENVLDGRRRLLQQGWKSRGGEALMGSVTSQLKFGAKGVLALTKLVGAVISMSTFAGADIGVLLSTQDPRTHLAGAAATAPTIAWAHFTYESVVPIAIDVLATFQRGEPSMAPFWLHIHGAADRFDVLIDARMQRSCAGLRLMLGYSSHLAQGFYHSCMATVAFPRAMLTVGSILFADMALYRCLCVYPVGEDYVAYVTSQCMQLILPSRRAMWQATILESASVQGMCAKYLNGIETQLVGAFDDWAMHAEDSARNLASFLDESLAPKSGGCSIGGNTAMLLTPLPVSHYHVCARTTLCDARCYDAFTLFRYELARVESPHAPPETYDLSAESPFFNMYANGEGSGTIMAIASLPAVNATDNCRVRCGDGTCIAAMMTTLRVRFYCVPNPRMLLATVFPMGLDDFELTGVDALIEKEGAIMKHAELLWRPSRPLTALLYMGRPIVTVSLSNQATTTTAHEIHSWVPDGSGGATHRRLVRSEDLASSMLTAQVQRAIGPFIRPQVVGCVISSAFATFQPSGFVIYLSFASQIKGYTSDGQFTQSGHTLYSIVSWEKEERVMRFFMPCDCGTENCKGACSPGMDAIIAMSNHGTFAMGDDYLHLYIPSSPVLSAYSFSGDLTRAQLMRLDRGTASVLRTYEMAGEGNSMMTWTRGDIFSDLPMRKPARDSSYHMPGMRGYSMQNMYIFQVTDGDAWLQELRPTYNGGFQLTPYKSQTTVARTVLKQQCTITSCSGCATSRLRLLCAAAQDCALSKCIGTVVQTRNVLCGVGSVMEQTSLHAIVTWRAIYASCIEVSLLAMRGMSGEIVSHVTLRFPTDQFYALVCSCKDTYAKFVGLSISLGKMMVQQRASIGDLDLTGTQDVGALMGEDTIKSASLASLVFNMISGSTLLPTMALHRWIICTANATAIGQPEGSLTIEFGDVSMDESWMQCASVGGLGSLINGNDLQSGTANALEQFVSFTLSLLSGVGDTILYGMQLSFDSSIDYITGLVWNVQDILYAFNMRTCKVPNYALRYVMQCACGDTPHSIPSKQRAHKITDGGLWCVGTLSLPMADGTIGIVYNPYTLEELSFGVRGVTAYIQCISESSGCVAPSASSGLLPVLVAQGVDPISVWARCKSNYNQKAWDVGAGALFSEAEDAVPTNAREAAVAWAGGVSEELLACLRDPGRMQIDFGVCLTQYHSVVHAATPAAYFLYEPSKSSTEPPDACLVFSGLRNASAAGSKLRQVIEACSDGDACDLNPLGRLQPQKIAAATVHGTVAPVDIESHIRALYAAPLARLRAAYTEFTRSSGTAKIDVALFSADGDFIHEFFDCMFMGPYSRVDFLPCDAEGVLECPFYARDELGGASRNFTACFGDDAMKGDHQLPFTCGSQARRAIIKYFFRKYTNNDAVGIGRNLSRVIGEKVSAIFANYTDPRSMGCHDPATGVCSLSACSYAVNGYTPCMETSFELTTTEVGDFIVDDILKSLPAYYAHVLASTKPLMDYYNLSTAAVQLPFQWDSTPAQAAAAQRLSHFDPSSPIVAYADDEVYSMRVDDPSTSLWSMCTALLGHAAMSLPVVNGRPLGSDTYEDMETLERKITREAMRSGTPFVWHAGRRHAPSPSSACRNTNRRQKPPGRLVVDPVTVRTPLMDIKVRPGEGLHFPLFGYGQYRIGDATCVCATESGAVLGRCILSDDTCVAFAEKRINDTVCDALAGACARRYYPRDESDAVLRCLKQYGADVRCPELAPSDIWGMYPVGCTTQECYDADGWTSSAGLDVSLDGARFLTDGRAGLRLPNYRHVNATYHSAVHYGQWKNSSSVERCFEEDELTPTEREEDAVEDYAREDAMMRRLLPAAQLRFDAHATAVCSRHVVEMARAKYLGGAAVAQAAAWRRRCEAKIRQLAACASSGVYYDVPPPPESSKCGSLNLPPMSDGTPSAYFAAGGGCVVVDRLHRRMYDGPRCAAENGDMSALTDACEIRPLSLLDEEDEVTAYSMAWHNGQRLSDDWLSNLAPELTLQSVDAASDDGLISHVLDWWPDDWMAPTGFHPTAASDPDELAPILFDSHLLYDADTKTVHYAHNAARDADLLYDTLGAAGVCRSPNVGMPMFDANTNRVCTRLPIDIDTPHMPVDHPKTPSGFANDEICAESHRDTPWHASLIDDPQSLSVGGIPEWQRHAAMDAASTTSYSYAAFPPPDARLTPLHGGEWSPKCAPEWGAARNCSISDPCPDGTTCLTLSDGAMICFSSAAFDTEKRQPCFRTDHCPDGMVCLADGGCSPLELHVWNKGNEPLEFTVVADECGFQEHSHPYTQSMRGASPWEHVPDILHMHGLCSHRDWFAYRHALRTQTCPSDGTALVCNASTARWPWVNERFDLQSANTPQTMEAGRALFTLPHPCDESFFHLQKNGKRLKVCSGVQGWQTETPTVDGLPQEIPTAHWMRTYSEATGAMHVGVLTHDVEEDVPLGFLGANVAAAGAMGDMGFGHSRFFRCADRMACQNPAFTYNGLEVERNFSEVSLRRCGAIGYFENDICWLDVALFPVFAQAVWGVRGSGGCAALWAITNDMVVNVDTIVGSIVRPGSFFCESSAQRRCAYAARTSTRVDASTDKDSVAGLTERLNALLRSTGDVVSNLHKNEGPTRAYEHINQCSSQLIQTVSMLQASMQVKYNSAAPSGVYYALRVTLYEFPIAWLHHAMLVALLSHIDPTAVQMPNFGSMGAGPVNVFLWSDEDHGAVCNTENLDARPALWRIICLNAHPAYTFDIGSIFDASMPKRIDTFASALRERVANDIIVRAPGGKAYCYTRAAWDCMTDDCVAAMLLAYNNTKCVANGSPYLDPCGHPELFDLRDRIEVSVDSMRGGPAGGIDNYLKRLRARFMEAGERVAAPVSYIDGEYGGWNSPQSLTVARVWPYFYKTIVYEESSFNLTDWLRNDVCIDSIPSDVCSKQEDTAEDDPCIFTRTVTADEIDRYLRPQTDEEPSIKLFYADADTTVVPICDLFADEEDEACILQYGGDTGVYAGLTDNFVPCNIQSIEAPPGVEVQAFALQQTLEQWLTNVAPDTACSALPPNVKSCTWRGDASNANSAPNRVAWWKNGYTDALDAVESFDGLQQSFDDMARWWPKHQTEWRNSGCMLHGGVCALRVRLEQSPKTRAVCANKGVLPHCSQYLPYSSTPFAVARGKNADIYRCAPCTRSSRYMPPPSVAPDARFGCYIEGGETFSIDAAVRYLQDPIVDDGWQTTMRSFENGSAIDVSVPLEPNPAVTRSMLHWGQRIDAERRSACDVTTPSACGWAAYSISFATANDGIVWDKAVQNPDMEFTMVCQSQTYTQRDAQLCNPTTDARRRQLADFVDAQYREANGVWMHIAPAGSRVGWRANVAHSDVGMFSIVHASANRPHKQVHAAWLLGDGPCGESAFLPDRICVESTERSGAFEAMHPWVGGDYNPFEGLDECPGTTGALCPCGWTPSGFNYTASFLLNEFPVLPQCTQQAYPQTRTMRENDPSNLCSIARQTPSQTQCLHAQGMLGGASGTRAVSSDELHGDGVATTDGDFLVQDLFDGGLWSGLPLSQAGDGRYGFMRMRRQHLHPAHIAFAVDDSLTGSPLVVTGIALLAGSQPTISGAWTATLQGRWAEDALLVASLYPIGRSTDWSCPLRAAAFWGGADENFAPLLPHPPLMRLLYNGPYHPFIATRSMASDLAPYATTNGACFFSSKTTVPINDAQNPCGLQGMLSALNAGTASLSRVVDPFDGRCMSILDAPDAGGTLRNGETMPKKNGGRCAALHRLTPFQMRVRGDAGQVVPKPDGRTTRDDGGDCHMGRALLWPIEFRADVAGTQCALTSKNSTHAVAHCPLQQKELVFRRARPLSLEELLLKTERRYRSQGIVKVSFVGPGGAEVDPEISFGRLYSTPLRRALAHDLVGNAIDGTLQGSGFIERYGGRPVGASSSLGKQRDEALWNASDWAWGKKGYVGRSEWARDRFGACNASYHRTFPKRTGSMESVKAISLCEPAPTGALQTLCKAMLQYRTDIGNINCQITGDCLYNPGAFYTPYAWSGTNQEFAADTLIEYYRGILQQPRFVGSTYEALCPERNALMSKIAILSRAQAQLCPAYQIEYLKDVLQTIKSLGKDLLEMAYCAVMFCVNSIGALFAGSDHDFTMASMMSVATSYLKRLVDILGRIIMPILNAMVNILFGTSSLGQVIRECLRILCEMYNIVIKDIVVPIWCGAVLPALYYILSSLSGIVGTFDSNAGRKISDVWVAISGNAAGSVDPKRCIGMLAGNIKCSTIAADDGNGTAAFLPQSLATRCWTDMPPGTPLAGGISAATYLSCTESDTCAMDPLHFDLYDPSSKLVSCASCQSVEDSSTMRRFGCNTYLKRCTCGVMRSRPSTCSSAYDCTDICAVSSRMDNIADSFASMPCDQCGGSGMQATCVEGTCACVDVAQAGVVQSCDIGMRGRGVSLLEATGKCFASTNPDIPHTLSAELALDFSTLAIVPCMKGLSSNACLGVLMPLSSGAGQFVRSLVVVFLPSVASRRRRLLSVGGLMIDDELAEAANLSDSAHCKNEDRERAKWCIHWRYAALKGKMGADELLTPFGAARGMLRLAWGGDSDALRSVIGQHTGVVPIILAAAVGSVDEIVLQFTMTKNTTARNATTRRKLLQTETTYVKASGAWECAALQDSIGTVSSAFWDTIEYYHSGIQNKTFDDEEAVINIAFPPDSSPIQGGAAGAFADAITAGQGRRIVAAFVSDVEANSTNQYITGRRLFRELGTCNYTTLTLAPPAQGGILYIVVALAIGFYIVSCTCVPSGMCFGWLLWMVCFPIAVMWVAYGVSPLCFPMLPPRLPRDLATGVERLLPPERIEIPSFLVSENCTLQGRISDGSFDARCFKKCNIAPFYMLSWQDTLAWWLCDLSPQLGRSAANLMTGGVFQDFASSAAYYADVIAFGNVDPDFVAAHRLCAFMSSHNIVAAALGAAVGVMVLPSVLIAIAEIFVGTIALLFGAAGAQILDGDN